MTRTRATEATVQGPKSKLKPEPQRRNAKGSLPVTVVGSANMDMVFRGARLPAPGETVLAEGFRASPGGKGANQAIAAARFGANVAFVGRLGSDHNGSLLRARLEEEGVDVTSVREERATPTGMAAILVGEEGSNLISVLPGANARVRADDVPAGRLRGGFVLMQLEIPIDAVAQIARRAAGRCRVVLDPAPAAKLPAELYQAVDIITPNEQEAAALTGEKDPVRAAKKLLRRGVKAVVVTLGARGSLLVDASGTTLVPAYRVDAVDATGAGDVFNGALAARLAAGEDMQVAMGFASAAAALSVTRAGAQNAIPTLREVRRFAAR